MTEEIIIDGVNVSECKYFNKVVNEEPYCNIDEEHLYTCSSDENCYYKQFKHLQRENKEKINIIEQMIKILYPNANDDELYDVTFNGEYIDKLKELKDTADTMLMANDIKKQDIDSLREVNARLEQENKELKEENIKVKKEFNNLIVEIISDTEYTGEIACNGESPKEHLKQCQKALAALEEIRTYLDTLTSIDSDFTNTETYLRIQDKINEVLNLS